MQTTIDFDMWWSVYPKKQGKELARKKFDKLSDLEKFNCYQGTRHQIENNPQWQKPQFIPMPATFLNQKRWEDQITIPKTDADVVISNQSNGLINGVWSAMTQMYGQTWLNKFGTEPNQVWIKALQDIPEHRIKRGLHRLANERYEFAPSLPKFLEFCAPTFGEEQRALPRPPKTEKNTALQHLQNIKNILKA